MSALPPYPWAYKSTGNNVIHQMYVKVRHGDKLTHGHVFSGEGEGEKERSLTSTSDVDNTPYAAVIKTFHRC